MDGGGVRMNDPTCTTFTSDVCGKTLTFHQQPGSGAHGKVVWDGSLALAKFFEHHPKRFNTRTLRCKRALEVGSGNKKQREKRRSKTHNHPHSAPPPYLRDNSTAPLQQGTSLHDDGLGIPRVTAPAT